MIDQADKLRKLMQERHQQRSKVLAVISGKGGVGKSNISINLALALQQLHHKVTLIDGDLGMGNLEVLLGKPASKSIVDLFESRLLVEDVLEWGPGSLPFLAGGTGLTNLIHLDQDKMTHFSEQITRLGYLNDYLIIDLGAGISENSYGLMLAADEVIVVTTPEPTAITDAYSTIKYMRNKGHRQPLHLIINKAESKAEGERTAANLRTVTKRFLHCDLRLLGILPEDNHVMKAVKAQKPFLLMSPKAQVSKEVKKVASSLSGSMGEQPTPNRFVNQLKSWFLR